VTDILPARARTSESGWNESGNPMKPDEDEIHNDMSLEGAEASDLQMLKAMTVTHRDVTLDPVDVGLLSSDAVMFHPGHISNLVEEFGHMRDFTTEPGLIPHFCG